jgi:hypothetical protein
MRYVTVCSMIGLSLLTGCASSTPESSETDVAKTQAAVTAASPATGVSNAAAAQSTPNALGKKRAKKDPTALRHRTGAIDPSAQEAARDRASAKQLRSIRPSPTLIERVEQAQQDPQLSNREAPIPSVSVLKAAAAPTADIETQAAAAGPVGAAALLDASPSTAAAGAVAASANYLNAVDNSTLAAFPEIRSQGGLGSCVCFAVGYYQYTHELGLLANWNNKNAVNTTKVSPRWLYNLINGGSDGGSWDGGAYAVLAEHGALTWSDFPYIDNGSDPTAYRAWPTGAATWRKALTYKAADYGYIDTYDVPAGISAIKAMLANGHVLAFQTYVYSWEFDQVGNDPSSTLDDAYVGQAIASAVDGYEGSHEMTIVGYNDNLWVDINDNGAVDAGEKGAFKIANSWGDGWQNSGFAWLSYDSMYDLSQVAGAPAGDARHAAMYRAGWIQPRVNYVPDVTGEFTLKTAERGSVGLQLQRTEFDSTQPFDTRYPYAFSSQGGPYPWDGTTSTAPQEATFTIDLTPVALSYGDIRYVLGGTTYGTLASTLSKWTLIDRLKSNQRTVTTDAALTLGSTYKSEAIRYKYVDPNKVPRLTTNATSFAFGSVPLGTTGSKAFTVTNSGTGDLVVTTLKAGNVLFSVDQTAPVTVAPGKSVNLLALFAPTSSQSASTTLNLRSNDSTKPSLSYAMSGAGSTTFGNSPLKLYLQSQGQPLDNTIGMRLSIVNAATTPIRLSDYNISYYFGDYQGINLMVWDTYYTTAGAITPQLRWINEKIAGIRRANAALDLNFASGTTIQPGQTLYIEGKLHDASWAMTFDENDDWSYYKRTDNSLAENVVIRNVATKAVLFGSSPE